MIYLDHAATSHPKPEPVLTAMERLWRAGVGNPGRGGHRLAVAADAVLDECRHRLNRFFRGASPNRFIFALNGTDALNMAFHAVLNEGDRVARGPLEHNSVLRPLAEMTAARRIETTVFGCDAVGRYDIEQVETALRRRTKLVVATHASNVTGVVQPIDEIGRLCRRYGALFLVDAAQTAGHLPIDVSQQPIDLLAAPGHKALLGPT
ncbi:MAG: aminotransferase class V-fold PLP-dependent enzyme, partial [Planctomycetia bacterium]